MKAQNSLTKESGKKTAFSNFITQDAIANRINQLASSKEEGTQFIAALVAAVTTTPALQECTHMSILNCGLQCLALKLSPTPQMGQFTFMPFKNNNEGTVVATPVIGYKGYVQLAMRSGYYKKIVVIALREGEVKVWNPLEEELDAVLIEDEDARASAPIAGFYGYFEYHNGFRKAMYWTADKMRNHGQRYSAAYKKDVANGTSATLWSTDFEGMGNKTILRQLISRWGIMSTEMQKAFEIENETPTAEFVTPDTTPSQSNAGDTPPPDEPVDAVPIPKQTAPKPIVPSTEPTPVPNKPVNDYPDDFFSRQ